MGYRLFLCLFVLFKYGFSQELGEFCVDSNTGNNGICRNLGKCPKALQDLQQGIFPFTCSFQGTVPIVCCIESAPPTAKPTTTSTTTTTTTTTTTPKPTVAATPKPTVAPTPKPTRQPGEKLPVGETSKEKCLEYGSQVYQLVKPPTLLAGGLVNVSQCGFKSVPLIIGGTPARPLEFPHQALLGFGEDDEKNWQCGGTLISNNFVLTAAHCTASADFGIVQFIRLGELDYRLTTDNAGPQDFKVAQIIKHPGWAPPKQYNDIALLRMDRPVQINKFIRPACLNTEFVIPPTNDQSTDPRYIATGWGRVEFGGATSSFLQKVVLDSFSHEQCTTTYKSTTKRKLPNGIVKESQMCAGGKNEEKDTCQGDSGGPIVIYHKNVYCMYKLVGVTSFGKTCGVKGVPGVYTRVSHYIDWIEKTVWPQ